MFIGEIAKRTGLSKDGIRHYESLGLIHSTPVAAGSRQYRVYDETTLGRLSLIFLAKKLHFGLREFAEPLDKITSDEISREERSQLLKEKLAEVDAKIAGMQEAREKLAELAATPDKDVVDKILMKMGFWFQS